MPEELSIDDLVTYTRESAETLREWQKLGLFTTRTGDSFTEHDALRARVLKVVLRRGVSLDVALQVQDEHPFLDREVERLFPRGMRRRYTVAEAAEETGVDLERIERMIEWGNVLDEDGLLDHGDVATLRATIQVVDGGMPEEVLRQMFRVMADATDRAAQATLRSYHMHVHQRFLSSGMTPGDAIAATSELSRYSRGGMEPTLMYFFRKALERVTRDDAALHVAEGAGISVIPEVPGEVSRAVVFVDLSSYTPLTGAKGDQAVAEVLERFSSIVRDATRRGMGHVVKQIGDAFLIVFSDAGSAVAAALDIEQSASADPELPATHAGIHCGRVLYRDGDYVGSVVNIASRLIAEAERHQIVVSEEVRGEAKRIEGAEFVALGKRSLKGVPEEMELFEVRRPREVAPTAIDPVCGMELGAAEAVARLVLAGAERAFCSDNCLRLFVETPERYVGRQGEASSQR